MGKVNFLDRKAAFLGASKVVTMAMMVVVSIIFTGCKKDSPKEEIDPVVAAISAKWEISDLASRYASFEFQTDGTYIVEEYVSSTSKSQILKLNTTVSLKDLKLPKTPFIRLHNNTQRITGTDDTRRITVHVGKYIIQGTVIVLTDLGMINEFAVNADEFSFTFKPNDALESVEYTGSKVNELATSDRTTLLCRMWIIDKIKVNNNGISSEIIEAYKLLFGDNWQNGMEEMLYEMIHFELDGKRVSLCVMFSKAGTYLSLFKDEDGNYFTEVSDNYIGISTVIGKWEWLDKSETKIKWEASSSETEGSGTLEVTELSLSKFKVVGDSNMGISCIEEFNADK
jgi:hypothetical protein